MLKIEVGPELPAVQQALRAAAVDTPDQLRAAAAEISAAWVRDLQQAAGGRQQRKLLVSGATAEVTRGGVDLIAGRGPALSGGLSSAHWYAVDYGMTPRYVRSTRRRSTRRRPRGGGMILVGRGLPARVGQPGRVIYRVIGETSQDIAAAWVRGLLGQLHGTPLDVSMSAELGQVSGSWR